MLFFTGGGGGGIVNCTNTFEMVANVFSSGGIERPAAQTQQQCQSECQNDNPCLGFDFAPGNPATKCFVHYNPNFSNRTFTGQEVNQYRIRRCNMVVTDHPPPEAGCSMIAYPDYAEVGGLPYDEPMSPSNCEKKCWRDSSCVAADWNRKDRKCYKHDTNKKRWGDTCCVRYEKRCQKEPVLPICHKVDMTLLINTATMWDNCGYLKTFSRNLAFTLSLSTTGNRLAVITFGAQAHVLCDFNAGTSYESFEGCLDMFMCREGPVDASSAYQTYRTVLLGRPELGDRSDATNYVITVTGSPSTLYPQDLPTHVMDLQQRGIKAMAIGVQPEASETEVERMATQSDLVKSMYSYISLATTDSSSVLRPLGVMGSCDTDNVGASGPNEQSETLPNQPPPASYAQSAIAVGLRSNWNSLNPIVFDDVRVNRHDSYDSNTGDFVVPADGIYFLSLSIGVESYRSARVSIRAPGTRLELVRASVVHSGTDMLSKDAILSLTTFSRVYITNDDQILYSNIGLTTSWSVFNLMDAMTDPQYFYVGSRGRQNQPGTLVFHDIFLNKDNRFSSTTNSYTCPQTGVYFFSLSTGLDGFSGVDLDITVGIRRFGLQRSSVIHNSVDTISRSAMFYCSSGENVKVDLLSGNTLGLDIGLTSFSGFYYNPKQVSPAYWAAYLTANWYSSTNGNTLKFDSVDLQLGVIIDDLTVFHIQVSGLYYIYISAGVLPDRIPNIYVRKGRRGEENGTGILDIYRPSPYNEGYDLMGRGGLFPLQAGDELSIMGDPNGGLFSDYKRQTSFIGFLVYPEQ